MSTGLSNSSATAYATPADFLVFFDANVPGLLVRDDDSQASATELLTDPILAAHLLANSGKVERTLLRSERYSPVDLATNLTGASLEGLKQIVCALTLQTLRDRRAEMEPMVYPVYKEAVASLEALATGVEILSLIAVEEAGLPSVSSMQPSDFFNGLPTLLTDQTRAWGFRANRRYPSGGNGGPSGGTCF